ncbi:glycoside hydrolase family 95 protein [Niabella hibiscisoli]|uniref:glycoside hydrolase family 95 protein n=1 Tax=Niabella hibiscisoli TaxID=1825928 RepID=UPI001F0D655D|nr:glycoside hydrolase family 95 protein [Niabella hibiscisoli]MCH5716146.1 glycoside hydrolase family 95 protein [Niabella hibiscisoli]
MNVLGQNAKGIDWAAFLERNDLVYDTLTTKWEEGLFTGNGQLGTMVYMEGPETLRIDIGRSDVADHRDDSAPVLYNKARLPIGYFSVKLKGKIKKIRQDCTCGTPKLREASLLQKEPFIGAASAYHNQI